jgi:hypothetical protein
MGSRDVPSIAQGVSAIYRPAIHFCQENVRQSPQNVVWRPFEQIRQPHLQPAFPQPDRVIDVGKIEEFDPQFRDG